MVSLVRAPDAAASSATAGNEYPLVLDGRSIEALVVGGGRVAARKAAALLAAGAQVRIVAPVLGAECAELLVTYGRRARWIERRYEPGDINDATLIVAATDDRTVNAHIASDARERRRLVNVADAPAEGNCITPAVHRAGTLTVAVSAGGVPAAAGRIRDAIAARFDARYGTALEHVAELRTRLLREGRREAWREASAALTGADFCDAVERGALAARIAQWR